MLETRVYCYTVIIEQHTQDQSLMSATELAPELLQAAQYFFDQIPFNRLVGIQVDSLSTEKVCMHVSRAIVICGV